MRIAVRTVVAIASVCIFAGVTFAEEETLVYSVNCPGGVPLRLWLANEGATCTTTSGVIECRNSASDSATAACSTGCDVIRIGNLVGCFHGDGNPNYNLPNFTVTCDNGRKFDLTGRDGDECSQTDTGTPSNPNITGGACYDPEDRENVSTSADCQTGCGTTKPGADCKER